MVVADFEPDAGVELAITVNLIVNFVAVSCAPSSGFPNYLNFVRPNLVRLNLVRPNLVRLNRDRPNLVRPNRVLPNLDSAVNMEKCSALVEVNLGSFEASLGSFETRILEYFDYLDCFD